MASWQGWKHPQWGAYLDHLSSSYQDVGDKTESSESSSEETQSLAIFPVGKEADYGDDVRWGAQVYLDAL